MSIRTILLATSTGICCLLTPILVFAQSSNLEVTRCKSIDRGQPIKNLWVDNAGVKWAANPLGVFKIQSCELGQPIPFNAGETSALAFPYGNVDFRWNKTDMDAALGGPQEITAAYFDEAKKQLWIGTRTNGAYVLNTNPKLQVADQFTSKNTKLRSNYITYLGKDSYNRFWVGTEEGVIIGTSGKWKDDLEGYAFQRMRSVNNDVYALADGELWILERGEKWRAININERALEGDPFDFDIAPDGTLWLLSRIVARYDLNTDEFDTYSGTEYYTSEYGRFIGVDADGAAWIATTDKGLFSIQESSAMAVTILTDKPVSCTGNGQDGVLKVRIDGGKAPYQYAWSTTTLVGDAPANVPPGEYSLTVTDANGKTKSAKTTLEDPRITVVVELKKAESAPGAADGRADTRVNGGKSPFRYQWDNSEAAANALKLTEGQHTVTVTDSKGCSTTGAVNISQKLAPLNLELSLASSIPCQGGTTSLVALTTGGKPPFTFNWNNASMQGDRPDNLKAGTYNLTVTDAAGNTARALFTIPEPDRITGTIQVLQPASTGAADGRATVTPQGGSGGFTYQWDTGETTATAAKLGPGTHTVTITDKNGCTGTASFTVTENVLPMSVVLEKADFIKCHAGTTDLKATVNGGKPPYRFKWNKAELTTENPTNLAAGFYELTVTDAKGQTATAGFNLQQPEPMAVTAQAQTPASIGGSDGKATVTASGGNGNFTYKWDNGEASANAARLPAGKHTVTVTDFKGCTATGSVEIPENILPLGVMFAETGAINCAGGTTGLNLTVNGGKGPFQYKWSNPAFQGDKPTNVPAGNYTVTVTDAAGKTLVAPIFVLQPEPIIAAAQVQAPASTGNADGKALASATGGNGNFTFKWDNGETAADAVKLGPGKHTVTATDAKGCTGTASVDITENILPLGIAVAETATITCPGGATSLNATVSGGKGPFKYAWSAPALTGDKPANVPAGNYTVTVTDATGKTATATFAVKQPDPVNATAQVQAPASTGNADGKALASATGGNGNFTFKWDNGETAADAVKLGPGKHTVTATDAKGCTGTASVDITENILPLGIAVAETATITCPGGATSLNATVSGGKGPFKYAWSAPALTGDKPANVPAGNYTVTVTDATGKTATATFAVKQPDPVNAAAQVQAPASTGNADGKALASATGGNGSFTFKWDNGETAATAVKLGPGKHTVTATDAKGCTGTASVDITENILPLGIAVAETATITCPGGATSLNATVSGGKGPFKYAWSAPALTGDKPANVPAGNYTVTVTDATGKTATTTFAVKQPDPVNAAAQVQAPASTGNADGKAQASATGGNGSFTFKWDNGETAANAVKLGPGKHTVTATDAKGCTGTASVDITENILPLGIAVAETATITCPGGATSLNATVSGGKGPFKYAWSAPALTGDKPANVPAGNYTVTVTDATGKTATATFAVKQPDPVNAAAQVQAPASTGNSDGKAQASATGGNGSFTFKWDNGETAANAVKLGPGKHTVTVTDAKGCTGTASVDITENILPLEVEVAETRSIKCAGETAALKATVKGGKPPYNYKWDNPALTGIEATQVKAGAYTLEVTDAKGSTQKTVVTVKAPDGLKLELTKKTGATTERTDDGRATIAVKGGVPPYTVAWDNGENQYEARKLTLGLHRVTVSDASGCSTSITIDINKRTLPDLTPGMLSSGQTIRMEQLRFDGDSSNIKSDFYPTLDELYEFMLENGKIVIEIGGHTNNIPPDEYCDRLSSARAKAVADYLVGKGIDPKRVLSKGYGKRKPVATNTTPEGRALNQRVEIKILSLGG